MPDPRFFMAVLTLAGIGFAGIGTRVEAAEAGCLFVNANPGSSYGNRSFTNIIWGDGYPLVSVSFTTDPAIVFSAEHGGGQKQRFANNGLTPNTLNNDNPDFISVYTNILRLNATIADTGTVTTTYTFSFPMTLIDLIVTDVDDRDVVQITPRGPGGVVLPPSVFELIADGDLSLTNNAGGRPPLELASPPLWNEVSGVLTAAVGWNENRSYTILRVPEGVLVESLTLAFTGHRADQDGPDGPGLGAHVYAALWATPRASIIQSADLQLSSPTLTIPTLPGLSYGIAKSSDLITWDHHDVISGPSAPTAHVVWVDVGWTNVPPNTRFYRYGRITN